MKPLRSLQAATLAAAVETVIQIEKTDGGKDGYFNVQETHDQEKSSHLHRLVCTGAGYSPGEWMHGPTVYLVSYAEEQIDAGKLTGIYVRMIGSTRVTVEWDASGAGSISITETQISASSEE